MTYMYFQYLLMVKRAHIKCLESNTAKHVDNSLVISREKKLSLFCGAIQQNVIWNVW